MIAVFTTSDIHSIQSGEIASTCQLERAITLNYDVYVVTTRVKFFPATDKWWMSLVPTDNVFTPDPETYSSTFEGAGCPVFIRTWIRLYDRLGITVPRAFQAWTEAMEYIGTRPSIRLGCTFL